MYSKYKLLQIQNYYQLQMVDHMITKTIKEYGKSQRQRIDVNKSDGLSTGEDVVLIPVTEYDKIKQNIMNLTRQLRSCEDKLSAKEDEIKIYKDQEQNLEELIKNAITPIDEHYQKELKNKDDKIKQLELQLKTLQRIASQYNIQMGGLSAIDMLFRKKHKELIEDFNNNIWIINPDNQIEDVNIKKLPGNNATKK